MSSAAPQFTHAFPDQREGHAKPLPGRPVPPQCTHVKTNGVVCGSPAVSGTEFCYHHSAIKTALAKPHGKAPFEGFAPIPFVFPEDRASMQINFFLLLLAFNEQRIDQKTYRLMLSTLKAMAKNLGKTGSLVEATTEGAPSLTGANRGPHDQGPREQVLVQGVDRQVSVRGMEKRSPRVGEEKNRDQPSSVSQKAASDEAEEDDPFADLHGLPQEQFNAAVRERVDKLLDDCATEGQKKAATNGNGVR